MAIAPKKTILYYWICMVVMDLSLMKAQVQMLAKVYWGWLYVVFYNFLFMDKREGVNSDSESLTQSCIFGK